MPTLTACGTAQTHTFIIPGVANFQLGFNDYQIDLVPAGGSIKIKFGKVIDEVTAKQYQFTIKLYALPVDLYQQIKQFAIEDYNLFLSTGEGSITLELSGNTYTGCYIREIQQTDISFYKRDEEEIINEIELKVYHPNYSLLV